MSLVSRHIQGGWGPVRGMGGPGPLLKFHIWGVENMMDGRGRCERIRGWAVDPVCVIFL